MSGFSPDQVVDELRPRTTVSIERTASGKVAHKERVVEGDGIEVVKNVVNTAYQGFLHMEALIAGQPTGGEQ